MRSSIGMEADERALLERWIEAWRKAGPELERIRRDEVRRTTDTVRAIRDLSAEGRSMPPGPPRPTSGLVEQQALFGKVRRR
jgi:hypothetical protein